MELRDSLRSPPLHAWSCPRRLGAAQRPVEAPVGSLHGAARRSCSSHSALLASILASHSALRASALSFTPSAGAYSPQPSQQKVGVGGTARSRSGELMICRKQHPQSFERPPVHRRNAVQLEAPKRGFLRAQLASRHPPTQFFLQGLHHASPLFGSALSWRERNLLEHSSTCARVKGPRQAHPSRFPAPSGEGTTTDAVDSTTTCSRHSSAPAARTGGTPHCRTPVAKKAAQHVACLFNMPSSPSLCNTGGLCRGTAPRAAGAPCSLLPRVSRRSGDGRELRCRCCTQVRRLETGTIGPGVQGSWCRQQGGSTSQRAIQMHSGPSSICKPLQPCLSRPHRPPCPSSPASPRSQAFRFEHPGLLEALAGAAAAVAPASACRLLRRLEAELPPALTDVVPGGDCVLVAVASGLLPLLGESGVRGGRLGGLLPLTGKSWVGRMLGGLGRGEMLWAGCGAGAAGRASCFATGAPPACLPLARLTDRLQLPLPHTQSVPPTAAKPRSPPATCSSPPTSVARCSR